MPSPDTPVTVTVQVVPPLLATGLPIVPLVSVPLANVKLPALTPLTAWLNVMVKVSEVALVKSVPVLPPLLLLIETTAGLFVTLNVFALALAATALPAKSFTELATIAIV